MTNKEQAAVEFIRTYTEDNGYSPNFAEIMEAIGEKSKAGMTRILNRLTDQGVIKRSAGVARSIRVVEFNC
jgi:repressor LexA